MFLCFAGGVILGDIPCSGVGTPIETERAKPCSGIQNSCDESNEVLLRSLREDQWSETLYDLTMKDAHLGRVSFPEKATKR